MVLSLHFSQSTALSLCVKTSWRVFLGGKEKLINMEEEEWNWHQHGVPLTQASLKYLLFPNLFFVCFFLPHFSLCTCPNRAQEAHGWWMPEGELCSSSSIWSPACALILSAKQYFMCRCIYGLFYSFDVMWLISGHICFYLEWIFLSLSFTKSSIRSLCSLITAFIRTLMVEFKFKVVKKKIFGLSYLMTGF